MYGTVLDQRVFEHLVQRCLPTLHDHFVQADIQLSVASLPWFLSLYISSMPMVFAFRIIDCFFLMGPKVLFQVGCVDFLIFLIEQTLTLLIYQSRHPQSQRSRAHADNRRRRFHQVRLSPFRSPQPLTRFSSQRPQGVFRYSRRLSSPSSIGSSTAANHQVSGTLFVLFSCPFSDLSDLSVLEQSSSLSASSPSSPTTPSPRNASASVLRSSFPSRPSPSEPPSATSTRRSVSAKISSASPTTTSNSPSSSRRSANGQRFSLFLAVDPALSAPTLPVHLASTTLPPLLAGRNRQKKRLDPKIGSTALRLEGSLLMSRPGRGTKRSSRMACLSTLSVTLPTMRSLTRSSHRGMLRFLVR
jgi:hypothetical protein